MNSNVNKPSVARATWLAGGALLLALSIQSSARADSLSAAASVDSASDVSTNTLGQAVVANVNEGNGAASASASTTGLSILVLDTNHFSAGAPGASASSNFDFSIEGDGRDVVLAFTVKTLGSWTRDDFSNFAINGGFDAGLFSATSLSPLVRGNFVDVQFAGNRTTQGAISQTEDFYANQYTSYAWSGSSPGNVVLVSTFRTGMQNAGRFQFSTIGGAGNGKVDFSMDVSVSIFGDGSPGGGDPGYAVGIGDVITSNGERINIAGAGPQGAVPEPAAWTLMILGFGGVCVTLRRRRGLTAEATGGLNV